MIFVLQCSYIAKACYKTDIKWNEIKFIGDSTEASSRLDLIQIKLESKKTNLTGLQSSKLSIQWFKNHLNPNSDTKDMTNFLNCCRSGQHLSFSTKALVGAPVPLILSESESQFLQRHQCLQAKMAKSKKFNHKTVFSNCFQDFNLGH